MKVGNCLKLLSSIFLRWGIWWGINSKRSCLLETGFQNIHNWACGVLWIWETNCGGMEKRANWDKNKCMPANAVWKFNFEENESGPSVYESIGFLINVRNKALSVWWSVKRENSNLGPYRDNIPLLLWTKSFPPCTFTKH